MRTLENIKEIQLKNVKIGIKDYGSNLDVFYGEPYEYFNYDMTSLHDFITEENIDDFIDTLQNKADVKFDDEDISKLHEELKLIFYPHSSEINN